MLVIRLQRRGRKGHAQYRVVVQDKRRSPKREKVVAHLGSYDPHSKTLQLDKEKAETYMSNGAHPSNRVAKLFKAESVKMPKWVVIDNSPKGKLKHPEKLRKNRSEDAAPAEEVKEAPAEDIKEEPKEESKAEPEAKAEAKEEKPAKDDSPTEAKEETKHEPKEASKEDKPAAAETEDK